MFENIFQKYITVKNIIFLIISILFIVFLSKINEVVILFFASYVIACSMEAPVKNLSKKFKRRTAAIIVILCSISLIFAFLVPVFMIG